MTVKTFTIVLFMTSRLAPAQSSHTVTAAMIDQWMTELSNWGRWGKQDQLGAVNLITPAKRSYCQRIADRAASISGTLVSARRMVETRPDIGLEQTPHR
jgi:hypothetical protein